MLKDINKYLIGLIAVLCIILGLLFVRNSNIRQSRNTWEHNYKVMQDSVQLVKTKYGEILYERGSLILEKKELEDALDISKKQIKEYEKSIGSCLAYISKLQTKLEIKDTVIVTEFVHDTITNSYSMHYNDEWLKFDETFSLKNPNYPVMSVYNILMNVPLKVGIGDNYTIFVQSDNPYFNITDIQGAVIDGSQFAKKPRRLSIGVYAGFGGQYGLINKKLDFGPQVGVGIGFRFF